MSYLRWGPELKIRGLGDTAVSGLISAAAARYGVPPALALAVATKESGLNQAAIGSSGEVGVFQLMPGTAGDLGVNPYDLGQNVDGGVRYLSQLYRRFGNWLVALEAYNGGQGNVTRGTVSNAARAYADSILGAVGGELGALELPAIDESAGVESGSDWASDGAGGLSPAAMLGMGLAGLALVFVAVSD